MRILVADEISNRTDDFELGMFAEWGEVDFLELGPQAKSNLRVLPTAWSEVTTRIRRRAYDAAFIGKPTRLWNPRKAAWRNAWWLARRCALGPSPFRLTSLIAQLRAAAIPVGGVDRSDTPVIDNSRFPILGAARVFFKRELPSNPANSFLYTDDRTEDTANIMRIPFFQESFSKLRPISLGVKDSRFEQLATLNPKKDIDVFFAGSMHSRPNRLIGLRHLDRLKEEGFRIVATEKKFLDAEYQELASRSLVCWSPEGCGSDCYRTYEVAALGSVPLLKCPSTFPYAPFRSDVDGLFYIHESIDLYDVLKAQLTASAKLEQMGRRAREHVRTYHRDSVLASHMVKTLLEWKGT